MKGSSASNIHERGRFSAKRKTEAVLRLLRGEVLDVVSREYGVSGAVLTSWREEFLKAGQEGLKSRGPASGEDREEQFKSIIAEQAIDLEILRRALKKANVDFPQGTSRTSPKD